MAKWVKLNVEMDSISDLRRNASMGINAEVSSMFNITVVNVDKITSYSPLYDNDGVPSQTKSEVDLEGENYMIVDMPFEELDKLIQRQ